VGFVLRCVLYALTAWIGLSLVAEHGVNTLFFTHGVLKAAAALLVLVVLPARKTEDAKGSAVSLNLATIFRYHKDAWSSACWGFKSVIVMVVVCYVAAICAHGVLARRRRGHRWFS
jgi:hypothetical protein